MVDTQVFDEDFTVLVQAHVVDCDRWVIRNSPAITTFGDADAVNRDAGFGGDAVVEVFATVGGVTVSFAREMQEGVACMWSLGWWFHRCTCVADLEDEPAARWV